MFRFHLVKDHRFQLDWKLGRLIDSSFMTRKLTLSPVEIQSSDSDQLCVRLKELMETEAYRLPNTSGNPEQDAKLNCTLKADIAIRPSAAKGYIRVYGTKDGNMLTALKNVMDRHGLETKVKIEMTEFGPGSMYKLDAENKWQLKNDNHLSRFNVGLYNLKTEEIGILDLSGSKMGAELLPLKRDWETSQWDHQKYLCTFYGVITITCMAFRIASPNLFDTFSEPDTDTKSKPYVVHKMLKEGLDSDVTIIALDEEKIKCHRVILKGQSKVFEAMFKKTSKSVESTTGIIEMDDMYSTSVHAFLAFLYLDDLEDAKDDSAIAFDLLRAAHKYNVPRLEKEIKRIFLGKPNNWFDLEVALQLFIFARKIDGGETMKIRATAALKSYHSSLDDSYSYKQLFVEDPDAARELCRYLMSRGASSGGPVAGGSEAQ